MNPPAPFSLPSVRWVAASLGDIADVALGKTPSRKDYCESGINKILKFRDVHNSGINWSITARGFVRDDAAIGLRKVSVGDIVMTASAHTADQVGRKVALVGQFPLGLRRIYAVGELMIIRVIGDGPLSKFVYYFLGSHFGFNQIQIHVRGGHLLASEARKIRVPLGPVREQTRIVTVLDSVLSRLDDAAATLERVRRNLERYRASVLQAAVEGRLVSTEAALARMEGREFEPAQALLNRLAVLASQSGRIFTCEPSGSSKTRLTSLPEGWCWARLYQVGVVASGQTPSGVTSSGSPSGDVPWFRVGDMNTPGNTTHLRFAKEWLTTAQVATLGLHIRPAGTIVFPKRGGAIATNKKRLLSVPSTYDLNTMGVIPIGPVGPYLWVWFMTLDLSSLSDGSNVPQINHGDMAPLLVPLPPEAEQARIVTTVERILSSQDNVAGALDAQICRLQQMRQSILKSAFEGRLVDQDPTDEPASILLARIRAERAKAVFSPEAARGPGHPRKAVKK